MLTARALTCEFIGTAFLLATVVGSGILADKLDAGNVAIAVMAVAFATGLVLASLILAFGSISSHFNPVVTLVSALRREFSWNMVPSYILAQIAGACAGVILANLMFELPAVAISQHVRSGVGQWLGEFIATFGLIGIITGTSKNKPETTPFAVGAYVAGAIWFTSSTCFANPAVTVARILTDTLTGIRMADVLAFVAVQVVSGICAMLFFNWLFASKSISASSRSWQKDDAAENERLPVEAGR
jgi:glycerol uptake facilitator-like aquaporin